MQVGEQVRQHNEIAAISTHQDKKCGKVAENHTVPSQFHICSHRLFWTGFVPLPSNIR